MRLRRHSCEYAEDGYDCDGNCLNDADSDGVCDEFEIAGCQDDTACNYNADATDSDDSCEYAEDGYDCDGVCLNDADATVSVTSSRSLVARTRLLATTTLMRLTKTDHAPTLRTVTTATATA